VTGPTLPLIFLSAALTLSLSRAPSGSAFLSLLLLWLGAAVGFVLMPPQDAGFVQLLWPCVAGAAAAAYLLPGARRRLLPLISCVAGLAGGAAAKAAGAAPDLLLLLVPGAALAVPQTPPPLLKWGVNIVCSWLIAVAILAFAMPLLATPGYERDHGG